MKHLNGLPRVALGRGDLHAIFTGGIGDVSIRPGDGWQPRAAATNNSHFLRDGEPRLERPIGNLSRGHAPFGQPVQTLVFQRVGHNGLEDSGGSHQSNFIIPDLQGIPAVNVSLLENGP